MVLVIRLGWAPSVCKHLGGPLALAVSAGDTECVSTAKQDSIDRQTAYLATKRSVRANFWAPAKHSCLFVQSLVMNLDHQAHVPPTPRCHAPRPH